MIPSHVPTVEESGLCRLAETTIRVTALPTRPRGRPPLLLELNEKLLQFLNAIRARGGVIKSHVVRATADAFIRSKHSPGLQHLRNFSMPRSWVQSVYKRMGYTRRMFMRKQFVMYYSETVKHKLERVNVLRISRLI